ncbi:MAG: hypothetical protein U9R38_03135 [Candidatus Margulisiibacteriota bacterium]|nr:hypothetical protein [Candidatus Margulisiibacteriota bacterium]
MNFFFRREHLKGPGPETGGGRKRTKSWEPPPWMWGVQDSGPFPYDPTEEDVKEEIRILRAEKEDIESRIEDLERMIKEGK